MFAESAQKQVMTSDHMKQLKPCCPWLLAAGRILIQARRLLPRLLEEAGISVKCLRFGRRINSGAQICFSGSFAQASEIMESIEKLTAFL